MKNPTRRMYQKKPSELALLEEKLEDKMLQLLRNQDTTDTSVSDISRTAAMLVAWLAILTAVVVYLVVCQ